MLKLFLLMAVGIVSNAHAFAVQPIQSRAACRSPVLHIRGELVSGEASFHSEARHAMLALRNCGYACGRYYGSNLDALYDCLGDLPQNAVVLVTGAAQMMTKLERANPRFAEGLSTVFQDFTRGDVSVVAR